ncbi:MULTISPECIES: membrane protein insertase YidC [unclassified Crossiella]|uniref:membrane protein insertase YidC n=1 Tax=unclassified Crossiella TaxID=2620835 RepID=UPI001FFFC930|nr:MULTISPECIES: membrane protein insertase YidC [unclassified Crossiella]MCK2239850.1 membrane protein insertase YidC [Crossiella sp. S99.2]MCK2252558.1 membrane protein insertase YidC [Crossiella sp. S99.1]
MSIFDAPVHGAYLVVSALGGPLHTVGAIIVFTLLVRTLLLPLSLAALRGERKRSAWLSTLRDLQETHKNSPKRLERELAKAQAGSGSLFAGMLPTLAQAPFFFVMYRLFLSDTVAGQPNGLLAHDLFGAPLGERVFTLLGTHPLVAAGLLLLLAGTAYWSGQLAARTGTTSVLVRLLPFVLVVFSLFLPLATAIYLLTTTTWTIAQRAIYDAVVPKEIPAPVRA